MHRPPQLRKRREILHLCLWNECEKQFEEESSLYSHVVDHLPKAEICEYPCGWLGCDFIGKTYYQIKSHIHIHVPFKPFRCYICSKSFKRKWDMQKHINGIHLRNIDSTLIDKEE